MIVADTSALAAIVFGEPDYSVFAEALDQNRVLVGGPTLTEVLIVVEARHGAEGRRELDLLVSEAVDEIVPVGADWARTAFAAWRRFGKGRHPAALNLGDCFSYATAALAGVPLLCKGDDFTQTDLAVIGT